MHRHEHHIARLEPDVAAGVAAEQVIVQIERRDRLAEALHFDAAHVRALGHTARRVQCREHRAERADLVRPWLRHFAHHKDLVRPYIGYGDVEPRRRVRAAAHPGVHVPEASVQHITQLGQCEIADEHLPDLGDEDEPLACHLQRVGELDVARENQDEHVARPQVVVGRDRP